MLSLQALTVRRRRRAAAAVDRRRVRRRCCSSREQIGYLRDAIAELPDRLRTVVEEYFFEQRKMVDIAAELGVTESRVSQLRSEALVLLRAAMNSAEDDRPGRPADSAEVAPVPARPTVAAVATRSTLAGRLAATTVLGETYAPVAAVAAVSATENCAPCFACRTPVPGRAGSLL